MNMEDAITDLKQFIVATVSQQTSDLTTRLDDVTARLDDVTANMATKDELAMLDQKLSRKIDDLQSAVAEALDASNDAVDRQLQDHEQRITRLEHSATQPA